ncbi:hypothetical protein GFY24_00665 [Nocardia sp. SYP-A9097]|uniref:phage gene 29 protein family protein n=1 Tax=Nocardia sp. SYP-A9097 TaxID=2663237 RepID=UPI00129C022D|nr:hypothetical protein [Nocardia sp. SYP-A9097]MRH85989.1 hypothetical protein [Nocardia sp. SYP-A9097]
MTWSQRADRLDGIRRDPETGIVYARESRHPLADWFRSVPMGQGLPGMQMPPEIQHLLAIHVFDNLRLPAPTDALYKPRRDKNATAATGHDAVTWVPIGAPDEGQGEDITEAPVLVADITGYTPAQIAAMKAQIRQEEIRQKMLAQSDTGGAP